MRSVITRKIRTVIACAAALFTAQLAGKVALRPRSANFGMKSRTARREKRTGAA